MPHLQGCPIPMATQATLDAAITFCERSMAIYRTIDAVDLVAGQNNYPLEASSQQQVVRVKRAFINGREISVRGQSQVSPDNGSVGRPTRLHVVQTIFGPEVVLSPTPDDAYVLTMEAYLRPRRTAQALDTDLFEVWMDAIVAGAVSKVQRMPAQPFTDPVSAAQHHAEFLSYISRARADAPVNRVVSTLSVRPRPLA